MGNSCIKQTLLLLCSTLIFASCASKQKESTENSIDIAGNIDKLTELKLSDIAKTVRYVPLETTDESLIGNNPTIKISKDKIIVIVDKQCLLFDKESGKFHCKVGHVGQDPEAYSSPTCWIDDDSDVLYFLRQPNQLMKYDIDGNFKEKINLSNEAKNPNYFSFLNSEITGYNNDLLGTNTRSLSFYDMNGVILDSIKTLLPASSVSMNDIENISVIKNANVYGNLGQTGIIIINCRGEQKSIHSPDAPVLWKNNDEIRFKEFFVDTIYTVKEHKLIPYISFNLGEWQWPVNEINMIAGNEKRLAITFVMENADNIFFQCIKGLYTNPVTYNGIYDKKNNTTRLALAKDKFKDDMNDFLAIQPFVCNQQGEYASLISTESIMEWLEDHPQESVHENIKFVLKHNEDMNPVVVLME